MVSVLINSMLPTGSGSVQAPCYRRRVRPPTLATHWSSIGVFHWQHSGLRLGLGVPACVPCLEGLPDLLDGQRLDGQGLRPLEVTLAFARAEGGFLRAVELLPHDFPV